MKKLLVLFAVFALTAPVFADTGDPNVLITCTQVLGEPNDVIISYEVLVEDGVDPGLMRAIALRISTDNTAKIDGILDYATGDVPADSTQIPTGYSVFMGSIEFSPQDPNLVSNLGDPVSPSGDPGSGGDIPTEEIVVELGTLYESGPPGMSGDLFRLRIDYGTEVTTVLTIVGESTRGGPQGEAVLENAINGRYYANVMSSGGRVERYWIDAPRGESGETIDQGHYDAWVAAGRPPNWLCPYQPSGDANGDGFANSQDYLPIGGLIGQPASLYPQEDVNHDGFVNSQDYLTVGAHIGQGDGVACLPLP